MMVLRPFSLGVSARAVKAAMDNIAAVIADFIVVVIVVDALFRQRYIKKCDYATINQRFTVHAMKR